MELDADSLERLVPDDVVADEATGRETLDLHLARYRFAAAYARPGRLLDMACGVGYGTRILADEAEGVASALGVDVSEVAVAYAQGRYANETVRYEQHDAMTFRDGEARGFDTVVSLETIEHLPDPRTFVAHVVTLVRPGGVLICSVPTTPSVDINPHHLHDFTAASFRAMLAPHGLAEVTAFEQIQRVDPFAVARRTETRMKGMRENLVGYYLTHPRAVLRRMSATLRHGFCNKYLTLVLAKDA